MVSAKQGFRSANDGSWLQAAVTAANIDFRSSLNSQHAADDVGFPPIYFRLSPSLRRGQRYRVLVSLTQSGPFCCLVPLPF